MLTRQKHSIRLSIGRPAYPVSGFLSSSTQPLSQSPPMPASASPGVPATTTRQAF